MLPSGKKRLSDMRNKILELEAEAKDLSKTKQDLEQELIACHS